MPVNRASFFDAIRKEPFPGILSTPQVAGCEAILAEWDRRALTDLRWLAYMLATAFHETARTMQPIAEYGRGKGHKYGEPVNGKVYYGRGLVQLTWDYNYKKMGDLLKVDLLSDPDLALNPGIAAKIMFEGMIRGTFTGRKLADYFTVPVTDFVGARKIINGTDRAELIAGYAKQFHGALVGSNVSIPVPKPPVAPQPIPDVPPVVKPAPQQPGWLCALISAIAAMFKKG